MLDHLSSRRVFLQKGMTLLAVGSTVPAFIDQTVMAMANPLDTKRTQQPSGKDGKILVVVQFSGGNDGLNMVVPFADDAYHRARPQLRHEPKTVLKLNDYAGLHPDLTPLKEMYDGGKLAVIQGVGYPNPNRSHFRSMDIWHSAQPERDTPTSGWIGRYFDNTCQGEDPHIGVSIGEQLPLSMQGERVLPLSFESTDAYRYKGREKDAYLALNSPKEKPAAAPAIVKPGPKKIDTSPNAQLDFLHRTAMDAQLSSDEILRITKSHDAPVTYPQGNFGQGLKTIAAMIAGGLPTRVYYVSLGGFDTHAAERNRHDQLMQQFAAGVQAFWKDMQKQENDQRVMMMTFSEFGRRVEQNASGGTDHGAAAPMFLMGGGVKEGIAGKYPSLTDLDQGDLKYNVDFRSVYATVLQNWLETPSKPILGQQFPLLKVVKA